MNQLETKLKDLPQSPGVYFHKDKTGEIIYIGKAAVLKNRVRQYFQKSRLRDPKTEALISEIADVDWMVVESELEALFLEAEMVRRYLPRYNILLRDDKAFVYIRIDYESDFPTVSTTRRPLDDGARYFGPYSSQATISQALKLLRHVFPYSTRKIVGQQRATLHYHLGLDPGLEEGRTLLDDYRANLRRLMQVIEGKRKSIEKELKHDMEQAAAAQNFELATKLRNQLYALRRLNQQVVFGDKEFLDISKDHALNELVNLLSLDSLPRRIEGYDISHHQGSDVVASMVVFTNGTTNKANYRKFKASNNKNNDFYNIHQTIKRRLSQRNIKAWGKPNFVLIDGGKGQLDAAIKARDLAGQSQIPFVGLAKRQEQIVFHNRASNVTLNQEILKKLGGSIDISRDFTLINLPQSTNLIKLLQRIRDESHRFAISYHAVLKGKRQTASIIEEIPGIGEASRKKLIKTFGSLRGVNHANSSQIEAVLGQSKAKLLQQYLNSDPARQG
ncbi:MAG TPA: excinuclease ABC subunit UvrC [Candidatus Dormibacteraeota bacterium]|nr:excinuclease ABC subunit UvrC [Candidatus Dormibacteraeota bacterium]